MKKNIRNFLMLTTLAVTGMHLANRFINMSAAMKNVLKTEYGNFYNWKYGKIFYTKTGKGSPIMLIHDLDPASSAAEWEKIMKTLSKHHTVYTLDLLGCGRSSKPNLTYTNYLFVQLVNDFVKNIIGEKATVISTGHSCSFSIMSCNMNPENFHKIILINPESFKSLARTPDKHKNALKLLIDCSVIGTFLYNMYYSFHGIYKLFYDEYCCEKYLVPTKTLDAYYESAHLEDSNGKYLLSSIYSSYTNIQIARALKNMDNSIYLIYSNDSKNKEVVASYTNCNPSIEAAYVSNSKYLPQLDNSHEVLKYINLFLNS